MQMNLFLHENDEFDYSIDSRKEIPKLSENSSDPYNDKTDLISSKEDNSQNYSEKESRSRINIPSLKELENIERKKMHLNKNEQTYSDETKNTIKNKQILMPNNNLNKQESTSSNDKITKDNKIYDNEGTIRIECKKQKPRKVDKSKTKPIAKPRSSKANIAMKTTRAKSKRNIYSKKTVDLIIKILKEHTKECSKLNKRLKEEGIIT